MGYETLILTREESYAVIALNRPPANAINEQLMRDLDAALTELEKDPAVISVIITGAGDRIFCGGADLGSAFSGGGVEEFIRYGTGVLRRIERFPKPVIAAVNGHATGGGCEIAMACHLRILKETARMGQTESNLGIIPGYGGTQRLPRLIGPGRAKELLFSAEPIDATEALRIGLVNRVVPAGQEVQAALEMARVFAKRAPLSLWFAKSAVNVGLTMPLEAALAFEIGLTSQLFTTEDRAEGLRAFLDKREAQFRGR
jgi:enoyl-CoA hydratase